MGELAGMFELVGLLFMRGTLDARYWMHRQLANLLFGNTRPYFASPTEMMKSPILAFMIIHFQKRDCVPIHLPKNGSRLPMVH